MIIEDKIPDLSRGSMINSYLSENSYNTAIQCALALESTEEETKYAFLAQECRFENVLADGAVIFEGLSRNRIFDRTPGELVVLQTWTGPYAFRTRGYLGKMTPYSTPHQNSSKVNVEYVVPKYLSFDETFELVREQRILPQNLYMQVSWGEGLNVFTPCRYINYPNSQLKPESRYLQPISGQVCFYEDGEFFIGYLACCLRDDYSQHIEFCIRDSCSVVDLLHGARKLLRIFPILKKIIPIYFHEYVKPVVVTGDCRFYIY